jgi:hypothetical protein
VVFGKRNTDGAGEQEEEEEEADEITGLMATFLRRSDTTVSKLMIQMDEVTGVEVDNNDSVVRIKVDSLFRALADNAGSPIADLEFHCCLPSRPVLENFSSEKGEKASPSKSMKRQKMSPITG